MQKKNDPEVSRPYSMVTKMINIRNLRKRVLLLPF